MGEGRPLVGIDFGTATTLVTQRLPYGFAETVPIGISTPWIPSTVSAAPSGELVFGEPAEAIGGAAAVRSVKQYITDDMHEPLALGTREFTPDRLIASLLRHVLLLAKANEAETDDAEFRLACPAIWDGPRRRRLAGLATEAGIPVTVADIVDEPIAAGLAWSEGCYERDSHPPEGTVLVFDYGGGTLDIALMSVTEDLEDLEPELTVLSARGVPEAGDALDRRIAVDLERDLEALGMRVDRLPDPRTVRALLLLAARRLKVLLSDTRFDRQGVPIGGGFTSLPMLEYTRQRLENAFRPQLDRALEFVRAALCEARLRRREAPDLEALARMPLAELAGDVDYVLLAGGMSQIPLVRAEFLRVFPQARVEYDQSLETPEESVATGLVVRADRYHRLNLPRPGFDLVLEWQGGDNRMHRELLYPAFKPLYSAAQVFRREGNLAHRYDSQVPGLTGDTTAELRAVSVDGKALDFVVDGVPTPHLSVILRRYVNFTFTLKVSGEIYVKDCAYQESRFRVERWPILRSGQRDFVSLSTVNNSHPDQRALKFTDLYSHPHQ
ncbi:Hsp70 family protein [Streptomyces sp. sk226]|uniref:Hsp70 family protein n=1 Tax=Streptomyces sp. sk226 TaxID=2034268 RepID=UPI000BF0E1A3|nr:Hsp70 family protein [Streptomyces sp. sk226]